MKVRLTKEQKLIMAGHICPYCKQPSKYVDSEVIYGKSYGMVYFCKPCDAYVGVHKGTEDALGRLADKQLRYWKKEAHKYFDKIWKLEIMSRSEAYSWLSKRLDIPSKYTHIGMFGPKTCKDVVFFVKQFLNDNRRLDLDYGAEPKTPYYEFE